MDSAIVIVHPDAGTLSGVDSVLGFAGGALGGLFAEAAVVAEIEAARKEADDDAVPFVVGVGEMMQFVANGGAGTEANEDRFGKGVVVYESNEDLIDAYDDAQSNTAMKDLVDTTKATIAGQAGTVWGDAEAGTIAAVQQANCAATLMQAFGPKFVPYWWSSV
jgi:hypothetical protein